MVRLSVAIRSQAVVRRVSKASTLWRQVATGGRWLWLSVAIRSQAVVARE